MPIEGFRPCCMHVQHAESSSLRTAWHVHPPSNGYILLGEEEGREYSLFAILPCIDSNGAFPSFPKSNFPFSRRYDTGEYQVM